MYIAMIKDMLIALRRGGKRYDVVCRFRSPGQKRKPWKAKLKSSHRPIVSETLESRRLLSISADLVVPLARSVGAAAGGTGLSGEYFRGDDFQTPLAVRTDARINFLWGRRQPVKVLGSGVFTAEWTGQIDPATTGTYTFYTNCDSGTRVIVGGTTVIDNFSARTASVASGAIVLTGGVKASIEVEYVSRAAGPARVQLDWSAADFSKRVVSESVLYPATVALGSEPLTGYYYVGKNFGGLELAEADSSVNAFATVPGSLRNGVFSVRWIGTVIPAVSGEYSISTFTDDGTRLWINGDEVIDQWHDESPTFHSVKIALTAGESYAIRMDYYENGVGGFTSRLTWKPPLSTLAVDVPFSLAAAPAAPTILTATAESVSQIGLTWSDVAGETGFLIERSGDGGATFTQAGTTAQGLTSFIDNGLTAGTAYEYEVIAIGVSGNSAPSGAVTVSTLSPGPQAVVASAALTSSTSATISWTASASATSYLVERSPNGSSGWTTLTTTSGTSVTDSTLAYASAYYYRVTASNALGSSAPSNVVSVTTVTTAPTDLTATTETPSEIQLSWNDVAGETGFVLERSLNGTTGWTVLDSFTSAQITNVAAHSTTYLDSGLSSSTQYFYQIAAVDGGGLSAFSNIASATTTAANPAYAAITALYGATGTGQVYSIDTTTGAATQIGTLLFGTNAAGRDPISGNLFYISIGGSSVEVADWNPNDGVNTVINASVPLGASVALAAFRQDGVFFLATDVGQVFAINTSNGAATLAGTLQSGGSVLDTSDGDMAFAPDGTLFIESGSELYSVSAANLAAANGGGSIIDATLIGPTSTSNLQIAFGQGGVLYATDASGQLYTLNTTTGAATAVGSPSGVAMGDLATIPLYGDLSVSQSASSFVRGAAGTYTITVSNAGPQTTVGPITLVDTLPSGVQLISSSGSGWSFNLSGSTLTMTYPTNVAAGASAPAITLDVEVSAGAADSVSNTVTASTTEFETSLANSVSTISTAVGG